MLTYEHVYNYADPEQPFNQCIIDSEASNIALYVNDIFKTTLTPNVYKGIGNPINLVTYKADDITIDNIVALLAKGTIEANEYSLLDRKSIFNDKNYCVLKKVVHTDRRLVGGLTFETATEIEINKRYLSLWYGNSDYYFSSDSQYDFYKFTVPLSGYYTVTVEQSYWYSDLYIYNSAGYRITYTYAYYSNPKIRIYLTAGATYVVKTRCTGAYLSQADYSIKILADGATLQGEVDLKADLIKYLVIENGKLVWSNKASKFYFNPKYFNLPQLYLKLYGIIPTDKEINYSYTDSQQLDIINRKEITINDFSSQDISSFNSSLDNNIFRTSGITTTRQVSYRLSLDNWAKAGDKIKLVSGKQILEFYYSVPTNVIAVPEEVPTTTTRRIYHHSVQFYNPNVKALFSFPLIKGVNNLSIDYNNQGISYNESFNITRT